MSDTLKYEALQRELTQANFALGCANYELHMCVRNVSVAQSAVTKFQLSDQSTLRWEVNSVPSIG